MTAEHKKPQVRCPHCDALQPLEMSQIVWAPDSARRWYACPQHGCMTELAGIGPPIAPTTELRSSDDNLRDRFAERAMHAELATAGALPDAAEAMQEAAAAAGRSIEQHIAANAYAIAQAMMQERARIAGAEQPTVKVVMQDQVDVLTLDDLDLHPHTKALVLAFARALAVKLLRAEARYGYTDGWMRTDWIDECRAELGRHVRKGDPLDVAAYAAFLWHHRASTSWLQDSSARLDLSDDLKRVVMAHAAAYAPTGSYGLCWADGPKSQCVVYGTWEQVFQQVYARAAMNAELDPEWTHYDLCPPPVAPGPRADFERWAVGAGFLVDRNFSQYVQAATRCAWLAWRAAKQGVFGHEHPTVNAMRGRVIEVGEIGQHLHLLGTNGVLIEDKGELFAVVGLSGNECDGLRVLHGLDVSLRPTITAAPPQDGSEFARNKSIFDIGKTIAGEVLTDDEATRLGNELQQLSGICPKCRGTGQDGDPPDTNGEGGWTGACDECGGSGAESAAWHCAVTDYWLAHYTPRGFCAFCGNHGFVDTTAVRTPAGVPAGGLHYCACPNGQQLRQGRADLAELYARYTILHGAAPAVAIGSPNAEGKAP